MPDFKALIERIGVNEGFRSKPYQCSEGVWTIGHGITWLTEEESLHILTGRISQLHLKLLDKLDWYKDMPPEVQGVIIEMCYQMGFTGFTKFKKAISNMIDKDWKGAATEMLDSRWAKQTSNRANRLAEIVREHGQVEQWITIAERFGLPLVLLFGAVYGIVKLFNWMANDMMMQIKQNEQRIEQIVIKLIDNSKEERENNRQNFEAILNRMDALVDILVKLSGNGLKRDR